MSNNVIKKNGENQSKTGSSQGLFNYGRDASFPICFSIIFSIVFSSLLFIFCPAVFPKGVFLVTACLAPNTSLLHEDTFPLKTVCCQKVFSWFYEFHSTPVHWWLYYCVDIHALTFWIFSYTLNFSVNSLWKKTGEILSLYYSPLFF